MGLKIGRNTFGLLCPVGTINTHHTSGYNYNQNIRGYMVFTMVCLVQLMHGHKTRTVMVTYSNAVYHNVGNTLDF